MHHSIDVRHLFFSYPDGHPALEDVTFRVAPGEKVALVGPNGAGKSTLLLHLNGILTGPGELIICGHTLSPATLGPIRAAVGMVFQDPDDQLFSPTVLEDVAFGPIYMGLSESQVRERVRTALASVGMSGQESRVSHHLSNGEKKRVAIASVLAMEPEVLVLDEPTAGLDPRGRRNLINLLRALPQTMLVSSHDLQMVAELLPRTILLDRGRVISDGSTAALLADPHLLEAHGLEAL
ncbi:MAG: cobalt ABC transporter ATP-binding protein [Chloroflexi bacterium RBG_16_64_43]|nr:MAG: cobalt ABC transporter ATP-binding protein [Chloroflexi bacterium RBG_16_64_43]